MPLSDGGEGGEGGVVGFGEGHVAVPDDLAAALSADPTAAAFFATLSNSVQRYHVDTVNAAKTESTRHRRIEKAIALFRQERQR